MKDDIGVSVKLIESEYDNKKLFCALCCGHVDKKVFAENFNKNTLSKGLVDISEDDVYHHFAQDRYELDGGHLFLGKSMDSDEFDESDDCDAPYPVTVIYGRSVNDIYGRLKSRMFFERECRDFLAEDSNLEITLEAYKTYKYDEDYVDFIIYNKTNYAHIILFGKTMSVIDKDGNEIMNTSFNSDGFSSLINKAIRIIK